MFADASSGACAETSCYEWGDLVALVLPSLGSELLGVFEVFFRVMVAYVE